jgi:integrase
MAKKGTPVPKLYDCSGDLKKEWYVSFRYTNPKTGERKPFPHRMGINYLHTKKERYEEAEAVIALLKDALDEGWNPFDENYKAYLERTTLTIQGTSDEYQDKDYSRLNFEAAMKEVAEDMYADLAPKTRQGYESAISIAVKAVKNLKMHNMLITEFKRRHIRLILAQIAKDRQAVYDEEGTGKKFSGNNYNKYKRYISTHFDQLEEMEIIEYNPCTKISKKQEIKTNIHRHATKEEEQEIKDYLYKVHRKFFIFLAIEALSGIRPKEIYGLQIKHVDYKNQCFRLQATEGRSKTKEARLVPIPNTLLKYIKMLDLEKYDPELYIFSYDFEPGEKRQHRQRATEKWKELVKDELGIDVTLYSFKGLGGEKKREAGINHEAVQAQFGHKDARTTNIYLPTEAERIRQDIIKNTPEF